MNWMLELALTGTGHCVDSLIIWLLVDYKREGRTHSHTHTDTDTHMHTLVRDYNGAHSHIAGDNRQKHKADGTDEAKGTATKPVVKGNSFQQLPFLCACALSLSLSLSLSWLPRISLSCLRFKMKTHKNRTHRAGPVFNFTHARVCQSNHKENYIAKLSGNEAWHSPSSSSSFFPSPVRSWPNFKLDIVSQGRRGKVNHSKNFDFI